jgi:hypothetical protein
MIVTGMIVRNETGRYLKQAIEAISIFSDAITIVDDNSLDSTVEECRKALFESTYVDRFKKGCNIRKTACKSKYESVFEEDESKIRSELFYGAYDRADDGDWVFIIDADEVIREPGNLRHKIDNALLSDNRVYMPVYDMWDETHYREDEYWNGHKGNFLVGIKKESVYEPYSNFEGKLHCGRFPIDFYDHSRIVQYYIPHDGVKHMGWAKVEDRVKKYKRYMRLDVMGSYGSYRQYDSILDANPNLIELKGE